MKTFASLMLANLLPLAALAVLLAFVLYKERKMRDRNVTFLPIHKHWPLWLAIFAAVFIVALFLLQWVMGSPLAGA